MPTQRASRDIASAAGDYRIKVFLLLLKLKIETGSSGLHTTARQDRQVDCV